MFTAISFKLIFYLFLEYIILPLLLLLFVKLIINNAIYYHKLNQLPQTASSFIFGHIQGLLPPPFNTSINFGKGLKKILDDKKDFMYKNGLMLLWISWYPTVVIVDANLLQNISVSNTPKGPGFDVARKFFGDGLVMQHYEKWKNRRKILSNGFQGSVISKYIPVMSDVCKFWVKKLDQQVNKPLNVVRLCQKIGMDIVCATAMGMTNLENPSKKEDEYRNAIEIAVEMILIRAINPFYWFDCIFNKTKDGKRSEKAQSVIRNFSAQLIEDKIEYHSNESDNNSNKVKDFASLLDYLVKIYLNKEDEDHSNNEKINFSISLDGVQEEVNTALFAGNESTASTIAWTLFLLGCNENAQQLVYQEIKQVFGEKGDNVQCSEESLKKLKFLECCIKESMRLCPSIHTITRKTPSDILLGGHVIPSGTVLSICIYYIHRNANYYPEPDVFKPERFLPENSVNRPKNSFIPFGFGHRQCLGQNMAMREIKILISQIVCRFQVQSCSKYEDIAAAFLGTLKSTTAVEMVFQRR